MFFSQECDNPIKHTASSLENLIYMHSFAANGAWTYVWIFTHASYSWYCQHFEVLCLSNITIISSPLFTLRSAFKWNSYVCLCYSTSCSHGNHQCHLHLLRFYYKNVTNRRSIYPDSQHGALNCSMGLQFFRRWVWRKLRPLISFHTLAKLDNQFLSCSIVVMQKKQQQPLFSYLRSYLMNAA